MTVDFLDDVILHLLQMIVHSLGVEVQEVLLHQMMLPSLNLTPPCFLVGFQVERGKANHKGSVYGRTLSQC